MLYRCVFNAMVFNFVFNVKFSKLSYKLLHNKSGYFPLLSRLANHKLLSTRAANQEQFKEHNVEIKTCGEIYKRWRQEKKFWKLPQEGLTFNVPFIDTHRNNAAKDTRSPPKALLLHGSPGSFNDFSLLTSFLYEQGIRVIVPNFPSFITNTPGLFRHSPEERAQYIADFLKVIDISEIDLLVCHSGAFYPGLMLYAANNVSVKSLAMLNPVTVTASEVSDINPFWPSYLAVRLTEFKVGFKLLQYIGPFFMKNYLKIPVRIDNISDPILSLAVMVFADLTKLRNILLNLSASKYPIFFSYSENDKLVRRSKSYKMAVLLGAEESNISHIDKNGVFQRHGEELPNLKILAFENGSHYVFWKYSEIIHSVLMEFFTKHRYGTTKIKSNDKMHITIQNGE